jgi:creatinine amidohydrolase
MQLLLVTWPEVEAYLATSNAIVVPVGSTEQHGPNGMIGTDALCAEGLARGLGEATGAMVAPTINVGQAQHHMAFPGSITLRPSTLIAVVRDVVASLSRHGFERFYFLNGHGGNVATLTAAFSEIYAEASLGGGQRPAVRCRLKNWWMNPNVGRIARELFGGREGSHATPSEVSLTWYLHPEHTRPMKLADPLPLDGSGYTDAEDYRRRFPDGRMGSDPSLASVEHGRRLYDAAVADLADDWKKFLAEP